MLLKLNILPPAQRALWPQLESVPGHFTLYGGTAIALRLGHRQSVDFDFFAFTDIEPAQLLASVPLLAQAQVLRMAPNTLTVLIGDDAPVRISFFGLPRLRAVQPPERHDDWPCALASLTDLAGMKMATIQTRAEAKDYLDLHAIWTRTDITPETAMAAACLIYGEQFNPLETLKALAWFGEETLQALPRSLQDMFKEMARTFDHAAMERAKAILRNRMEGT